MPQLDLIESQDLDTELVDIIQSAPMPGLGAGPRCAATAQAVEKFLKRSSLAGSKQAAALWLLAGELERSHSASQSIKDRDGSYWHGIMHRREGDFSNAKYWFRQTSAHPVIPRLIATISQDLVQSQSTLQSLPADQLKDPTLFLDSLVDRVQQAERNHVQWKDPLQKICWWEWQLLFDHCRRFSSL